MSIGVTGKSEWEYLTERYLRTGTEGKSTGISFAALADAGFAERAAKQRNALGTGTGKAQDGCYMGESYEERLSKITDGHAAAAFQEAYAKKMAGSVD